MSTSKTARRNALAKHLEVSSSEIDTSTDPLLYALGRAEYLVLTYAEADERAREYIAESLWAFNPTFIASHSKVLHSIAAVKALGQMQAELCEDANPLVRAMIDDLEHFMDDAIKADGRGHFLAQYDGEEVEAYGFYIYRVS